MTDTSSPLQAAVTIVAAEFGMTEKQVLTLPPRVVDTLLKACAPFDSANRAIGLNPRTAMAAISADTDLAQMLGRVSFADLQPSRRRKGK